MFVGVHLRSNFLAFPLDARPTSRPLVIGFYVNWDPESWRSLQKNISNLTHVAPVWLHLEDNQGHISEEMDKGVVALARSARVPILPVLNNYKQEWRSDFLSQVLSNPEKRLRLVAAISRQLSQRAYAGINIDFEQLPQKDRKALVEFMKILYAELHAKGFLVTQSVPVDDAAYDLKQLSHYNDFVIPMFYDEHFDTGPAGPIASLPWFERMLRQAQSQIPSEKLIAGLANYGYDWIPGRKSAEVLRVDEILRRMKEQRSALGEMDRSLNPSLSYSDTQGKHHVWFLDAGTLSAQYALAESRGLRGLALWRLGLEDPAAWNYLARLTK